MTDKIIPTETDGIFVYTSDEGTSFFCDKDGAQLSSGVFNVKQEEPIGSEFVLETYKRRDLRVPEGGNIHTFSEEDINNHKFSGLLDFEILLNDFGVSREDINKSWAPNKPRDYEALLKNKSHSELVVMIADMDKGANHMARMSKDGTQALLDIKGIQEDDEIVRNICEKLRNKIDNYKQMINEVISVRADLYEYLFDLDCCFDSEQVYNIMRLVNPLMKIKIL